MPLLAEAWVVPLVQPLAMRLVVVMAPSSVVRWEGGSVLLWQLMSSQKIGTLMVGMETIMNAPIRHILGQVFVRPGRPKRDAVKSAVCIVQYLIGTGWPS